MTIAYITFAVFTLCNSARVIAYVPQITKAATDREGAKAISFTTWSLFLVSNASAVLYALVNKDDWTMALLFLGNAAGCSAILLIGALRRCQYRCRQAQQAMSSASASASTLLPEGAAAIPDAESLARAVS